jgi:hypothetical protein
MGAHQDVPSNSITSFVGSWIPARRSASEPSIHCGGLLLLNRNNPARMGAHRDVFGSVQTVSARNRSSTSHPGPNAV